MFRHEQFLKALYVIFLFFKLYLQMFYVFYSNGSNFILLKNCCANDENLHNYIYIYIVKNIEELVSHTSIICFRFITVLNNNKFL